MQQAPRALSQLCHLSRRLTCGGRSTPNAHTTIFSLPSAVGLSTKDVVQARGVAGAAHQAPVMSTRLAYALSQEYSWRGCDNTPYSRTAPGSYPAETMHFPVAKCGDYVARHEENEVARLARIMFEAKRRYNSGQARRLRQQRQQSKLRRRKRKAPSTVPLLTKDDLSTATNEV